MHPDRSRTVAVITGGEPVAPSVAARLEDVDHVIAADSGLQVAVQIGLTPDVVVGDLDSADPTLLDRAGLEIDRHPRAKDRTDLVLALDRALDHGARRVIVASGGGGRLDHALANLLVLASPRYAGLHVQAFVGDAEVAVVRDRLTMSEAAGTVVSLFAVDGPAHGVSTEGLRFPLHDEVLAPLSSRGVSNEFVGGPATVAVASGTLLVIRPSGAPRDAGAEDGAAGDRSARSRAPAAAAPSVRSDDREGDAT